MGTNILQVFLPNHAAEANGAPAKVSLHRFSARVLAKAPGRPGTVKYALCATIFLFALANEGRSQNLADFGFNAVPRTVPHPVLVVLPNYPGLTVLGTSLQWHQFMFDDVTANSPPRFSVAGWAAENSNGRLALTPASPLPMALSMMASDSFGAIGAANPGWSETQINSAWLGRIVKTLIDGGFDFRAFDSNHDGIVQCPEELTIFVVNPAVNNSGGVNRDMAAQQDDAGTFSVGGRAIIAGHLATFDTIIHEFGHSFGIGYELYTFPPAGNAINEGMTVMSTSGSGSAGATLVFTTDWQPARLHFDPFHKMRFGWSEPRIVSLRVGGRFTLPVATSRTVDAPLVLYDPLRGTQEYFILEYRSRLQSAPNYDSAFAIDQQVDVEGLVIWQVAAQSKHSLFGNWTPIDPALAAAAPYSSSIVCRCPPDLNVTANRPWIGGLETPALKWFDGSTTATRVRVLPFAVGAASLTVEVLAVDDAWVDFSYPGQPMLPETGQFDTPYNSFAEGTASVGYGGRLHIKAGRTTETVRSLEKPMAIDAVGGPVTIGR